MPDTDWIQYYDYTISGLSVSNNETVTVSNNETVTVTWTISRDTNTRDKPSNSSNPIYTKKDIDKHRKRSELK